MTLSFEDPSYATDCPIRCDGIFNSLLCGNKLFSSLVKINEGENDKKVRSNR